MVREAVCRVAAVPTFLRMFPETPGSLVKRPGLGELIQ